MKYWVFQSNQVLGPYEPDALGKLAAFSADSLVCPEGRRGTSMGDWTRAGMVPDLSVALIRASQEHLAQASVATLSGLPAEPTLKDLASIGSLQEKTALLEDAVQHLQESLRVKDAELSGLHQQLADKDRSTSDLKQSIDERLRQAEALRAETADAKNKIAELEQRLGEVRGIGDTLGSTLGQTVESQKNVAHDIEAQGSSIAGLTRELETLRAQLKELQDRPATPAFLPSTPAPAPGPTPTPAPIPFPVSTPVEPAAHLAPPLAEPALPASAAPKEFPSIAPPAPMDLSTPSGPRPAAAPLAASVPPAAFAPPAAMPASEPAPFSASPDASPMSAFGAGTNPGLGDPGMPTFDPLSPMFTPTPDPAVSKLTPRPAPAVIDAAMPRRKSRVPSLLFVIIVGGGVSWLALDPAARGKVLSNPILAPLLSNPALSPLMAMLLPRTPPMPAHLKDNSPLPPPSSTPTAALPSGAEPGAGEPSAPGSEGGPIGGPMGADPRQAAIEIAKAWKLADGRTLAQALSTLSPSIDNPWMAEPQPSGLVRVNYSAHGSPGAPTTTYSFEVDPTANAVSGYDTAAKAVLLGKAARPPAPPKPAKVRLKPKPAKPKPEESLDSLLGGGDSAGAKGGPLDAPKE